MSDSDFKKEVLDSSIPVMVVFYLRNCGYAIDYNPAVLAVANRHVGALALIQIDMDTNPNLDRSYGITGSPTTLFFSNGGLMQKIVGEISESDLERVADRYVN